MLKKSDLIKNYINGYTEGYASNLKIEGDKLINYSTTIAYRFKGYIILNSDKYSMTTSTNQNMIRRYTPKKLLVECNESKLVELIYSQNQTKVLAEILAESEVKDNE